MAAATPTRPLGASGPQVSALGFGAMGISAFYGATEPDESRFKILDKALSLGCTFWDSSDMYGDNEELLGKWFARNPGAREKIFLATKFAICIAPDGSRTTRSDPEYVKQACEKSLKRLGVDCIDLYYCHRVDKKTPIEKTVRAMAELKNEGKIRYLGLSEVSAATLRRAHKVHPIAAVQIEYSPFTIDIESPETNLLATCRELGVATVAYSPLGRGMLTGQYKSPDDFEEGDFRKVAPRFSAENFPKNLKLVDTLKAIADRKECTPGQLTLAWLMRQGQDIIPIPGTKKEKYLVENWESLKVTLTDGEEKEVRKVVEEADVHGERYMSAMMGSVFADTPEL